jgi:hypothetical protein
MLLFLKMKLLVPYLLLCSGRGVMSFVTPVALRLGYSPVTSSSHHVDSTTILRVSSSVPPEDGSDKPEARVFGVEKEVKGADDEMIDCLVQGGLFVFAASVSYTVIAAILSTVSGLATSTADVLSKEGIQDASLVASGLWSVVSALAIAIWEGLHFFLPIIFKAIYQGIQIALPVLKDVSSQVSEFAAPYVEEARSEVSQVAAPYVEQLSGALQQATDATIVEPIQKASESLSKTVDSSILAPFQEFQQAVDSNLVAPVKGVQDGVSNAVDANVLAPINHVKDVVKEAKAFVTSAVDSNLFAPIKQVKDTFEKSITTTSIGFRIPTNRDLEDATVSMFKAATDPTIANSDPVLLLGPDHVVNMEGSVE